MESFVHITWFLTKYFDYSLNSLGSRDNNHKREVGEGRWNETDQVLFALPILFLFIRVGYHRTVPQMEFLSLK